MSSPESRQTRDAVLIGLHIAFAVFYLPMSFLLHGRLPGLSADESAALGFLLFFGLGLPAVAIAIILCGVSVAFGGRWLSALAGALVVAALLVAINVWLGIVASLGYLSFGLWVLVERNRHRDRQRRSLQS